MIKTIGSLNLIFSPVSDLRHEDEAEIVGEVCGALNGKIVVA